MIHQYESPCNPERIPFRVVMTLFAMGTINKCHTSIDAMVFFQAETVKMGIAAANKQLSAHPHHVPLPNVKFRLDVPRTPR